MKIRLAITALGCAMFVSLPVFAQQVPWLSDSRLSEGAGIRLGDFELHPGVAAQAGYDSNSMQRAESEQPLAFWRFRVIPHLTLATIGAKKVGGEGAATAGEGPKLRFRAGLFAVGNLVIPAQAGAASETAARTQRNFGGGGDFNLDILPERPWGGDVYGMFRRITQPSNSPEESAAWNRDTVTLGTGVSWRPRGGVFDWRLGYEFRWNHFEQQAFRNLDNVGHTLKTANRWRFLPRTAVIHMTEVGMISYSQEGSPLPGSQSVRTRIGINGLVTHHFGLMALAGWGASFYKDDRGPVRDFDSAIGQAQLTWYVSPQPLLPEEGAVVGLSTVAAGYARSFTNSYFATYYQLDRIYLNGKYLLAHRVALSAEVALHYHTFPPTYWSTNSEPRYPVPAGNWHQTRMVASGFAEYRVTTTLGVNASIAYNSNLTKNLIPLNAPGSDVAAGGPSFDDLSFSRVEAYFGLRWFL